MSTLLKMIAVALAFALGSAATAQEQPHRLAIHVDENDPQVMNMALNNIQNTISYYNEKGEDVIVELVAYGPGLNMLVADKSPVADRISQLSLEIPNLSFAACENTRTAMSKKAGKEIQLLDEAKSVPSGVVRLIELQEEGYAYVRP
ncbi:MAG: DsrE family protein [Tranquillimonas sp.]|jgi:intracellular sulfur oxidation DsrE/DsrF family protein